MSLFKKLKNSVSKVTDKFKGSIIGTVLGGPLGLALGASYDQQRADNIAQNKMIENQNALNMQSWNLQNDYNLPKNQMQRYLDAGLNPNLIYGSITNGNASSAPELSAGIPGNSTSALAGVLNQAGNFGTKLAMSLFLQGAELDLEQKEANVNQTRAITKNIGSSSNQAVNTQPLRTGALGSVYNLGKQVYNDSEPILKKSIGDFVGEWSSLPTYKIDRNMENKFKNGSISKNQILSYYQRQYDNTGNEKYLKRMDYIRKGYIK